MFTYIKHEHHHYYHCHHDDDDRSTHISTCCYSHLLEAFTMSHNHSWVSSETYIYITGTVAVFYDFCILADFVQPSPFIPTSTRTRFKVLLNTTSSCSNEIRFRAFTQFVCLLTFLMAEKSSGRFQALAHHLGNMQQHFSRLWNMQRQLLYPSANLRL